MTGPPPYFDRIRRMKNPFNYHLSLVSFARQHGIRAAARTFQTTVLTVRKRARRYRNQALQGLQARSRAPHFCPHKIRGEVEQRVRW